MNPIIQHQILPMRTAQLQFELAGCETSLTTINPQTRIAYVDGKAGPACMELAEWERYKVLCATWQASPIDLEGAPVVSMLAVESEDAARQISEPRIGPEDLRRIYRSLRICLHEVRACVTSAQHTLSVEDYGEALQAANEKLSLSIGCVEGLESGLNIINHEGGPEAA